LWTFVAVSCTICANLYLFPVIVYFRTWNSCKSATVCITTYVRFKNVTADGVVCMYVNWSDVREGASSQHMCFQVMLKNPLLLATNQPRLLSGHLWSVSPGTPSAKPWSGSRQLSGIGSRATAAATATTVLALRGWAGDKEIRGVIITQLVAINSYNSKHSSSQSVTTDFTATKVQDHVELTASHRLNWLVLHSRYIYMCFK